MEKTPLEMINISRKYVPCKEQKTTRPKPEEVAEDFLNTENIVSFLDIIKFIRANKIGIAWVSSNQWGLNVKSKRMGFVKMHEGNWLFRQQPRHMVFYEEMENSDLKQFVNSHIRQKVCLYEKCYEGPDIPIAKTKTSICTCWPLRIYNPNGDTFEQTKRLILHSVSQTLDIGGN